MALNTHLHNLIAQYLNSKDVAEAERLKAHAIAELTKCYCNEHTAAVRFHDLVFMLNTDSTTHGSGHKLLAQAVLEAARIHEESWSVEQTKYTVSLAHAATLATNELPDLQEPVYLLLTGTWNESLDWAKLTVGGEK